MRLRFFSSGNGRLGINHLPLVEHFIDKAIDDDPPVESRIGVIRRCMPADAGRAVIGEGIVPFGALLQGVYLPQVIQKNLPDKIRRRIKAIQVDSAPPGNWSADRSDHVHRQPHRSFRTA